VARSVSFRRFATLPHEGGRRSATPSSLQYAAEDLLGSRGRERHKHVNQRRPLLSSGGSTSSCQRCGDFEEKFKRDRKKFFTETEHVRRGVEKALEQLSTLMPSKAFQVFKDSLQLDVRFYTAHGDDAEEPHDEDERPEALSSSMSGGFLSREQHAKVLSRMARLEEEIERLERENQILKDQSKTRAGGLDTVGTSSKRHEASAQTTEVFQSSSVPRSIAGNAAGGVASSPASTWNPQAFSQTQANSQPSAGISGIDKNELQRLMDELNLQKLRTSAAESKLKNAEDLKARELKDLRELHEKEMRERDIAALDLRRQLEEQQARLAKLENDAAQGTSGLPGAQQAAQEVKRAHRSNVTSPRDSRSAAARTGRRRELPSDPQGARHSTEASDDESTRDRPVLVDACVGNGPGPGLSQEPVKCRGKSAKALAEINKTGRSYLSQVRSEPRFATMGAVAGSVPSVTKSQAPRPVVKAESTATLHWSLPGRPGAFALACSKEAEPYLLNVWEQRPQGHRKPSKLELIKLGATVPENNGSEAAAAEAAHAEGSYGPPNADGNVLSAPAVSSAKRKAGASLEEPEPEQRPEETPLRARAISPARSPTAKTIGAILSLNEALARTPSSTNLHARESTQRAPQHDTQGVDDS